VQAAFSSVRSKVNMRALKESIWALLQTATSLPCAMDGSECRSQDTSGSSAVEFHAVMSSLSSGGAGTAGPSVHLAFMCVLHLANEKNLAVKGVPAMDRLDIVLP
jgi:condensin complex subunit 2